MKTNIKLANGLRILKVTVCFLSLCICFFASFHEDIFNSEHGIFKTFSIFINAHSHWFFFMIFVFLVLYFISHFALFLIKKQELRSMTLKQEERQLQETKRINQRFDMLEENLTQANLKIQNKTESNRFNEVYHCLSALAFKLQQFYEKNFFLHTTANKRLYRIVKESHRQQVDEINKLIDDFNCLANRLS